MVLSLSLSFFHFAGNFAELHRISQKSIDCRDVSNLLILFGNSAELLQSANVGLTCSESFKKNRQKVHQKLISSSFGSDEKEINAIVEFDSA